MQLKTILNAIEKHKSFVYSEARWSRSKSQNGREIEFQVQPRRNSKPICSGCRKPRPGYDRLKERRFEYVPLWAMKRRANLTKNQIAKLRELLKYNLTSD